METDGELDSEGQVGVSWAVQGTTVNILRRKLQFPTEPLNRSKSNNIIENANIKTETKCDK